MANGIVFITRPGKKTEIPIYVRVRFEGKDYMVKIPEVTTTLATWPNGQNAQIQIRTFYPVLGKIHDALSDCLKRGDFSKDKLDEVIYSAVDHSISPEAQKDREGHPIPKSSKTIRIAKGQKSDITFVDYFEQFVKDLESGKRKTEKGVVASARTITNYKQGLNRLKEFQKSKRMRITWEGINRDFISELIQFLQSSKRGDNRYNTNTVAKRVKEIKHLVRAAREDGVTDIPVPEYRFGEVSVTIVPDARGATLTLDARWKRAPAHIYFRIPYFVKDWKGARVIELSPSEKGRRFEWRIDENADRGLFAEILHRDWRATSAKQAGGISPEFH